MNENMDERVQRLIERSGANWEAVRNREVDPVILQFAKAGYELTLEPGAHHPNWTVRLYMLTEPERQALDKYRGDDGVGVGVGDLLKVELGYREIEAFILSGRKPGWSICTRAVSANPVPIDESRVTTNGSL